MSEIPSPVLIVLQAAAIAIGLWLSPPASAAVIVVNTLTDVVAEDGRCSLREAVTAANTQASSGTTPGECAAGEPAPTEDRIQLGRGVHRLTLGAPGEDANLGGDLDVTESVVIAGAGPRATVIENGLGSPSVAGDGDRLFHVDPAASGDVSARFRSLALQRGDVGCEGADCVPGGSAIEMASAGAALDLEDAVVRFNRASCRGESCGAFGGAAAIRATDVRFVRIFGSRLERNLTECGSPDCRAGASVVAMTATDPALHGDLRIEGSRVRKNQARCKAPRCVVDGIVDAETRTTLVTGSVLLKNEVACEASECRARDAFDLEADFFVEVRDSVVRRNTLSCEGFDCNTDVVIDALADLPGGSVLLERTKLVKNRNTCVGESCDVDDVVQFRAFDGHFEVRDTEISRNELRCSGLDCDTDDVLDLAAFEEADTVVQRLELTRNQNVCVGLDCDVDDVMDLNGGHLQASGFRALRNVAHCQGVDCDSDSNLDFFTTTATIDASEFVGNRSSCSGAGCDSEEVVQIFTNAGLVTNSLFARNRTTCDGQGCILRNGGALHTAGVATTIRDSVFSRNRADGDGAAIFNRASHDLNLLRVTIEGHRAGGRGGAIFNSRGVAPEGEPPRIGRLTIEQSDLIRNRADTGAGGIHNEGEILEITGTRFFGNSPLDCEDVDLGTGCPAP